MDYYLSKGVEISEIKIGDKFGKSDHHVVTCIADNTSPITRRQNLVFSKTRARRLLQKTIDSNFQCGHLAQQSPLEFFRTLSAKLRRYALVNMSKPRNYFNVIPKVEDALNAPGPDWPHIRKLILSCRSIEFLAV